MPRKVKNQLQRLLSSYEVVDGCWIWKGRPTGVGYGSFNVRISNGKYLTKSAHRVMFEEFKGPIPAGYVLDHLCSNRLCVNPGHLEIVTQHENLQRSALAPASVNMNKSHCLNGHAFDESNTYIHPQRKTRHCKACALKRVKESYNKKERIAS